MQLVGTSPPPSQQWAMNRLRAAFLMLTERLAGEYTLRLWVAVQYWLPTLYLHYRGIVYVNVRRSLSLQTKQVKYSLFALPEGHLRRGLLSRHVSKC